MLRFLLLILVLFAAPFAVHALWQLARGEEGGQRRVPVQWLALCGGALALIAILALVMFGGGESAREGVYTPPSLEGGRIVPGGVRPSEEPPETPAERDAPGDPPSRRR